MVHIDPMSNDCTTLAGTGSKGHRDGYRLQSWFNQPIGVAVDSKRNVFIADTANHCIRKIALDGKVNIVAGAGASGYQDGVALRAQFFIPMGIAVDAEGNLIVADSSNHRIRKVSPDGSVTTLAGTGETGHRDHASSPLQAQFKFPIGVALDSQGNVIVADCANHCIRKIIPGRKVMTVAGDPDSSGYVDGKGRSAKFNKPHGVAVDTTTGVIVVADSFNHRVRRISPDGVVTTLAGTGVEGFQDGDGLVHAQFNKPIGVAVDGAGAVVVGDSYNHRIRLITSEGWVSTLAGCGEEGYKDGEAYLTKFQDPFGVCVDADGSVVVADTHNHIIRIIAANLTPSPGLVNRAEVITKTPNKPKGRTWVRDLVQLLFILAIVALVHYAAYIAATRYIFQKST
mmetsp:Transcript_9991/g.20859  ORF Transcript_9991/g.20859 Transcript_9991/m.20859 type:complete len:398 (+) Transcript_9991:255-1448(+)|eukprot:CAMPEP_0118939176 /NCGR_PEP_ID=MMETSP1169-20130426/28184_1 /TAXON_ID=36882 /ORGANISM="Pyramimonas obovata, Strain CCMP722" /LENGTH=397 /DNA_ID=CAMNT_0006883373 /DNA_START=197 /DNA_END=1390 /DNA_ORIENTATION=+